MFKSRIFFLILLTLSADITLSASVSTISDRTSLSEGLFLSHSDTLDHAKVDAIRDRRSGSSTPLQIVDAKAIERRGIVHFHEAVKTLAGISVKDYGGVGGLKTVSVRSLGAQHTAVSYDGFAISDAQNGQVDISSFMLENVAKIVAVTGPSDDIFCSPRLMSSSGLVSIITNDIHDKFEASAGLNADCFGTWNPILHIGGRLGKDCSLSADANYLKSSGSYPFVLDNGILQTVEKRLNSDVETFNTEINFKAATPATSGKFSLKATYNSSERGLPGPVILYYQNPSERLWDKKLGLYAKYNWLWGIGWKGEFSLSYNSHANRYLNDNKSLAQVEDNHYLQQESYVCGKLGYSTDFWKFALTQDVFANFLDSNLPEFPFPTRLSSLTALSAQYLGKRLKITASLLNRVSKEWLKSSAASHEGKAPESLFRVSPSVSISYSLLQDKSLMLRAFVKDGYRVPTFNDLYYAKIGNTALVPEKALLTNLGIVWKYRQEKIEILASVDGYFNLVRDKITAIPTMFIWKMRNIGKVVMAGTDLSASIQWRITPKIHIYADANYSYQYAIDITDSESKTWQQQIPYTPRHTGNFIISADTHWITATYTLSGCGNRYSLPQNIRQNLIEAYIDHSISIGRKFNISPISLKISAEALNLSNNNYEVIQGYPMPGRSYRISLKIIY